MEQRKQIDLKKRKKDDKELNGWVSFTTHVLNERSLDELAAISEMLDKAGVSIEISRNANDAVGTEYDFITIRVNKEQYKKAMSRHAGRKADFNKKYDQYGKCTVAELQEQLRSKSKTKIAEELGCSRMTLYRILENISKMEPDGEMSIWHFTS